MPITDNHDVTAVALRAIALAQMRSHESVSLEHVLRALLERPEVQKCLTDCNLDQCAIMTKLEVHLDSVSGMGSGHLPNRSREFDVVFARTLAYAQFSPRRLPTGLDVLFQIVMFFEDSFAASIIIRFGLTHHKLRSYIARHQKQESDFSPDSEPSSKQEAINYIKKYCLNLNKLASLGKVDPVIGRRVELDRSVQILARRTKNNIALVGEAGVGKSAIVEGLAFALATGDAPSMFTNTVVWSLDVGSLVAGTRFRGDFEERMKFLLAAFSLIEADLPILFIDEIHVIMEAGSGNRGSLDISNLLKPALARGKLRCIGATTDRDWRQHFEKDRALMRRFKKLLVDEPSIADTKLIMRGVRNSYESFHSVTYTDAALDAAVMLTSKYLHDGRLPDKAIDIIDEVGAKHHILGDASIIDVDTIEREVSIVARIPQHQIQEDEAKLLSGLEPTMKAVIFGQDHAIRHVVDAVLISRAGIRDVHKPEGSYLFMGPTGVGKTELARQLAKSLGIPFLKIDMSEYMERHSVSKLIGSPPGYVGYGDGGGGNGLLINMIDRTPSCVLLLDEIEKAHLDVCNILLQVMEDAVLTNAEGKTVSFRNVILIMTSNVGVAAMERNGIGFLLEAAEIDDNLVKQAFTPEFRNRLDAIVTFHSLDRSSVSRIVVKFMDEIREQVQDRGVTIEITDAAKKWLAEKGYDPVYGARPLKRLLTERIKRPLSRSMLFGALKAGGVARIVVENHNLVVKDELA